MTLNSISNEQQQRYLHCKICIRKIHYAIHHFKTHLFRLYRLLVHQQQQQQLCNRLINQLIFHHTHELYQLQEIQSTKEILRLILHAIITMSCPPVYSLIITYLNQSNSSTRDTIAMMECSHQLHHRELQT